MTDTDELVHDYGPRGACKRLMEDRSPEIVLSGPAGTGKSRACLEKLHLLALLNPGMRGVIVRKTRVSLKTTALVTWRRYVATEAIAAGLVVGRGGEDLPYQYLYTNGSVIDIGGMDEATRIMSSEYDCAYIQEAIELSENDWEAISTRLRNGMVSFQQQIGDTNPSTPTHWLKQRCDRGQTVMLESRHEDNPRLFDGGQVTGQGATYLARLDNLTGVRFQRLRQGLWVAAEGQIYEEWDPAVHLVDRFEIPQAWTRWWAVDFGYRNPAVIQWWAEDPDNRLWLYREIYMTGRLVADHAKTALARVTDDKGRWLEPKPRAIVCDHDAEDRATLERELGLGTTAANKQVKPGIEAVQQRLRPDATGKPALFVMRDSLVERDPELVEAAKPACTAEEIPGYVWAPSADGKPNKEEPLKLDDHGADALRYVVAERDLGARPRVRFI